MSENNLPSAKPDPEVAPGEFDFIAPVTERPRVRRRALTQATTPKPAQESPALEPEKAESRPAAAPSATAATRPATAATAPTKPAASTSSTQPKTAASSSTSPHGTRPATLYYSSGSRQDKETTSPMKTTSSTSPSASTTAPASSAPRTATSTPTRASSVADFRTNVERQSREQKSVGGVLSILVYTLIAVFVVGASLAGYGAYVITKQLDKQSVTMKDFDERYAADYKDINARLVTTMDNLSAAQAQIERQQTLIVKQQETISKLLSASEDTAEALKMERATRTQETANLRTRLKNLEYTGPSTRKY